MSTPICAGCETVSHCSRAGCITQVALSSVEDGAGVKRGTGGQRENAAPFTLTFTSWECGHHMQRPEDIPVHSAEQATLILRAIASAISQPGNANAALLSAERVSTAYVTDDYVSTSPGDLNGFSSSEWNWLFRPVVFFGTQAEIDEIHSPALAEAVEIEEPGLTRWDGRTVLGCGDYATTTLALAKLEELARPLDAYEDRRQLFDAPPVFKPAGRYLVELRETAASEAAYQAELAAEKAAQGVA